MIPLIRLPSLLVLLACCAAPALAQENQAEEAVRRQAALSTLPADAARRVFSQVSGPAALATRSIGAYGRGCIAGAVAMPQAGPAWQTMRPSRNRNWGHPALVRYLQRLATDARADGWPSLLIGDMSQARGGPMLTGHASHQLGLEADVWLTPGTGSLGLHEREEMSAVDMVQPDLLAVRQGRLTEAHVRLLRRAASYPGVDRIFVNAAIKRALCERAGTDRAWLARIRPWWGHTYHFHVALNCPAGEACSNRRAPVPPGDGCNELPRWFRQEVRFPTPSGRVAPPVLMSQMPDACRGVATAASR